MDMQEQCTIEELFNDFDFSDMMENEHLDTSINLQEINSWHEPNSPIPHSHDGSDSDSGFSGQSHATENFHPTVMDFPSLDVKLESCDIPGSADAFHINEISTFLKDCDSLPANNEYSRSSAATPVPNSIFPSSSTSYMSSIQQCAAQGVKTMLTSKGVKAIIIPTRKTPNLTVTVASPVPQVAAASVKGEASLSAVKNVFRIANNAPANSGHNEMYVLPAATSPSPFPGATQARAVCVQPPSSQTQNHGLAYPLNSFPSPLINGSQPPRMSSSSSTSLETPVKIQPKFPLVSVPISSSNNISGSGQCMTPCPSIVASSYAESVDFSYMQPESSHHVERLIKKQVKMIKNRQAASLSRQRKKEYLERMEKTLEDLREENNLLRHQNMEWQNRYMELESLLKDSEAKFKDGDSATETSPHANKTTTNGVVRGMEASRLQKMASNANKKPGVPLRYTPYPSASSRSTRTTFASSSIFLCIAGLFLLNWWNPFFPRSAMQSSLALDNTFPSSVPVGASHISRSLLQVGNSEEARYTEDDNSTRLAQCLKQLTSQKQQQQQQVPGQESNASQSRQQQRDFDVDGEDLSLRNLSRITSELNDILYRHSMESQRAKDLHLRNMHQKQMQHLRRSLALQQMKKMPSAGVARNSAKSGAVNSRDSSQLQLYDPLWEPRLEHFVPDTERENDTMYLVSLGPHHLMYPASANERNQSRSKMTFVIPTMFGLHEQDRPGVNQLALMRISCEVKNFTVVHVDKWKLPYLYQENMPPPTAQEDATFQRRFRGG